MKRYEVIDIMGRELIQEVSWASSVAMWRIHTELKMGVTQIGRFFDRDHSIVHHNIRKVKDSIGAETWLEV